MKLIQTYAFILIFHCKHFRKPNHKITIDANMSTKSKLEMYVYTQKYKNNPPRIQNTNTPTNTVICTKKQHNTHTHKCLYTSISTCFATVLWGRTSV